MSRSQQQQYPIRKEINVKRVKKSKILCVQNKIDHVQALSYTPIHTQHPKGFKQNFKTKTSNKNYRSRPLQRSDL